jgi:hypothetical protein
LAPTNRIEKVMHQNKKQSAGAQAQEEHEP